MTATVQQTRTAAINAPPYAGFWIRVLAFLIDGLAIGVIVSAVTIGQAGIVIWDHWFQLVAWRNFIESLIGFAYFTLFWSAFGGGRTLGMRLLGLQVVGADGRPIGYAAAVIRWIGIVISAAAVLIGLVWVAFDPRKQGWHDKIASTFVVHVGADEGPAMPAIMTRPVARPVARGFALVIGLLGSALGITGVILALMGDAVVGTGTELSVVAVLTSLAVVGAALAWIRPSIAAIALGAAVVASWIALGPLFAGWYDGLQSATAIGPAAETQYWFDAPAMGFFVVSGILMAVAALLALIGVDWGGGADQA